MQFFLDDNTVVPIRLYSSSNAPKQQKWENGSAEPPRRAERSVPGYPFIRFVDDDDYDGSFSFDALHALRLAYANSPLMDIQQQLRTIQHQRAQAQLQRSLLLEQLQEHRRREQRLDEVQRYLEHQRQVQAKQAAHRARTAYLARLAKEEEVQDKPVDQDNKVSAQNTENPDGEVVFYPPFHFFNHILSNQLNTQDQVASKNAQKNALGELLDSYFGKENGGTTKNGAAPRTPSQQLPAVAKDGFRLTSRPVDETNNQKGVLDQSMIDSVLRVVRNRLDEISAEEDYEESLARRRSSAQPSKQQKPIPASGDVKERKPSDTTVNVEVVDDSPAAQSIQPQVPEDHGTQDAAAVEVEEPTDYRKAAESLRNRIDQLNDDNMFLSLSPLLGSRDDSWTPAADNEAKKTSINAPMDVDGGNDQHNEEEHHSDSEFSQLLNSCKCQLKEMQDLSKSNTAPVRKHRSNRSSSRRNNSKKSGIVPDDAVTGNGRKRYHLDAAQQGTHKTTGIGAVDGAQTAENRERAQKITESLRKLHEIGKELDTVRKNYNYRLRNTQLSFVADKNGNLKLAYNRSNSTFHEYQEVLQKLLLKLDAILSYGDLAIRDKRKAIVKKIQNTMDALDQFAADQESELSESSPFDGSSWADESSSAE